MKIIFTTHAEKRIQKRKILKEEVVQTIEQPDSTIKKHGKYYFQKRMQRGAIEVCCEKTENNINIITVYWM